MAVTNAVCFYVMHTQCAGLAPAGNGLSSPCRARVCTSGCTSLLFRTGTPAFMGGREENTCERLRRMRGLWRRTTLIRCGIQFCEMTQDVGISLSLGQGWHCEAFSFRHRAGKAVSWSPLHTTQPNLGLTYHTLWMDMEHQTQIALGSKNGRSET